MESVCLCLIHLKEYKSINFLIFVLMNKFACFQLSSLVCFKSYLLLFKTMKRPGSTCSLTNLEADINHLQILDLFTSRMKILRGLFSLLFKKYQKLNLFIYITYYSVRSCAWACGSFHLTISN